MKFCISIIPNGVFWHLYFKNFDTFVYSHLHFASLFLTYSTHFISAHIVCLYWTDIVHTKPRHETWHCVYLDIRTHIILIEYSKHQRSKFTRISLWKKLFVDFDESLKNVWYWCVKEKKMKNWFGSFPVTSSIWYTHLLREQPIGTIFEKSFMPLSNFLFCDCWKKKFRDIKN